MNIQNKQPIDLENPSRRKSKTYPSNLRIHPRQPNTTNMITPNKRTPIISISNCYLHYKYRNNWSKIQIILKNYASNS